MRFRYVVRAEIDDPALAERYCAWLVGGHVAEVGALLGGTGEVVRIEASIPTYESRYAFASREAYAAYERDHAPRMRAEGLAKFPSGVRFTRSVGESVYEAR